jgi:hypothetical protein
MTPITQCLADHGRMHTYDPNEEAMPDPDAGPSHRSPARILGATC